MRGFAAGYERFARLILMIFVANVAFMAHALIGLVLVGFFPSVAATATTFRTWALAKDRSWSIGRTWTVFHRAWKSELVSANAFGWPVLIIWPFLIWEYYLANWNYMGTVGIAASGMLLLVNVLYAVFVLNLWVVRANFDERPWWIVRNSLRMIVARPVCTLMTLAVALITGWAWYTWPGLLVTFGFALPLFATVMVVCSFGRLHGMDLREDREKPSLQVGVAGG